MTQFELGLMLMGYGLGGVFATLILFFVMIKLLTVLALRGSKDR